MSRMQEKLKNNQEEKKVITEKVKLENISPTENEQGLADKIIATISREFADVLNKKEMTEIENDIINAIKRECDSLEVTYEEQRRIEKTVKMTVLGNGPIEVLLKDPEVTDILVQRYDNIIIERNGKLEPDDVSFNSEEHLQTIIKRIVQKVGREINLSKPIVDARLADGSRVNATIPPISPDGATLTIRKFNNKSYSGRDYLNFKTLNKQMLYFIERCVKGKISIFVSGGTGAGKTSLLNMVSSYIPVSESIITIEDTCELKLQQPNVRRMEVRPSTAKGMMNVDQESLVMNALRQRPDRIVLGEVRDGSVVHLISAMSTGHDGSLSTLHANSPRNAVDVRIPILFSMNKEADFSEESIAMQIAEALQLIIQIKRFKDGVRRITHISHVNGIDANGKVSIRDIFVYDKAHDAFVATGYIPKQIIKKIQDNDLSFDESIFATRSKEVKK